MIPGIKDPTASGAGAVVNTSVRLLLSIIRLISVQLHQPACEYSTQQTAVTYTEMSILVRFIIAHVWCNVRACMVDSADVSRLRSSGCRGARSLDPTASGTAHSSQTINTTTVNTV